MKLTEDEIAQLAFENGQPADNGDGYKFTQEEWDEFVRELYRAEGEAA